MDACERRGVELLFEPGERLLTKPLRAVFREDERVVILAHEPDHVGELDHTYGPRLTDHQLAQRALFRGLWGLSRELRAEVDPACCPIESGVQALGAERLQDVVARTLVE